MSTTDTLNNNKALAGSNGEFAIGPNIEIKIPSRKIQDAAVIITAATLAAAISIPIEVVAAYGGSSLILQRFLQNALARVLVGN